MAQGESRSRRSWLGLLVVLALWLAVLALPGRAAAANTGECGQETGLALIKENPELDSFSPTYIAVGQVLCGEFLGPGSRAMIVPILPATCGGYFGWAAFRRLDDGSWQLVSNYENGQRNLVAVGTELEETVGILGRNDPRCTFSGTSTKTRTWHWDGEKLVAGPWTVHLETGVSVFKARGRHFGLICQIGDGAAGSSYNGVSCKSGKYVPGRVLGRVFTQRADLRPSGQVRICRKFGVRSCGGAPCGCDEDILEVRAGEQIAAGRFTCRIRPGGVSCSADTGEGFFMNESKAQRLP